MQDVIVDLENADERLHQVFELGRFEGNASLPQSQLYHNPHQALNLPGVDCSTYFTGLTQNQLQGDDPYQTFTLPSQPGSSRLIQNQSQDPASEQVFTLPSSSHSQLGGPAQIPFYDHHQQADINQSIASPTLPSGASDRSQSQLQKHVPSITFPTPPSGTNTHPRPSHSMSVIKPDGNSYDVELSGIPSDRKDIDGIFNCARKRIALDILARGFDFPNDHINDILRSSFRVYLQNNPNHVVDTRKPHIQFFFTDESNKLIDVITDILAGIDVRSRFCDLILTVMEDDLLTAIYLLIGKDVGYSANPENKTGGSRPVRGKGKKKSIPDLIQESRLNDAGGDPLLKDTSFESLDADLLDNLSCVNTWLEPSTLPAFHLYDVHVRPF